MGPLPHPTSVGQSPRLVALIASQAGDSFRALPLGGAPSMARWGDNPHNPDQFTVVYTVTQCESVSSATESRAVLMVVWLQRSSLAV